MIPSRLLHHVMAAESPHAKQEKLRVSPAGLVSASLQPLVGAAPPSRSSLEPLPLCFARRGFCVRDRLGTSVVLPATHNWLNTTSNSWLVN